MDTDERAFGEVKGDIKELFASTRAASERITALEHRLEQHQAVSLEVEKRELVRLTNIESWVARLATQVEGQVTGELAYRRKLFVSLLVTFLTVLAGFATVLAQINDGVRDGSRVYQDGGDRVWSGPTYGLRGYTDGSQEGSRGEGGVVH